MTDYDFDTVIDRRGTGSLKYDCAEQRGHSADELPLWVADMDFRCPQPVIDAMKKRADAGVFGYTEPDDAYFAAVKHWFQSRHGWTPHREWLTVTPGVVYALACCVKAFAKPGEGVLIQPPVYYPFSEVVRDNGRVLVEAPLTYVEKYATYRCDFDVFERAIVDNDVKLFLLCNPHNPVGRVWSRFELKKLGDICAQHGVVVVSDEIHADFARPGFQHTVFATLGADYAQNAVICTAATKSFNLAGLQASNIFIPNPELKARFDHENAAAGYSQANIMGLTATQAAYEEGGPWLDALKGYLDGNYGFLRSYLGEHAPQLKVIDLQSTYLVWVDCRALGLDDNALQELVEKKARLWLDLGAVFGASGSGFVRFNIACPRSVLAEALCRLCTAIGEQG